MKEPKILDGFNKLTNKNIVHYINDGYSEYEDAEILITSEKEMLMFYPRIDWDYAELIFLDINDIKKLILDSERFRKLLLEQEITDNEYVNGLLEIENKKKQTEIEKGQKRKLQQYNKLKEELGL